MKAWFPSNIPVLLSKLKAVELPVQLWAVIVVVEDFVGCIDLPAFALG